MAEKTDKKPRPMVIGANHRSSSMSLRDRLFLEEYQVPDFLEELRAAGFDQAMVLSTCDRIEVQAIHDNPEEAAGLVRKIMAAHAEVDAGELDSQTYLLTDDDAVRQIFMVAASLDSLVVGEPQVLGQVKAFHRMAHDAGMTAGALESLLQAAYAAAKRVRTETAIGEKPVSIAAAAARLGQDLHGDLSRSAGLLIGTGEMGELVASAMLEAGLGDLTVIHPTVARAEALARELGCHVAEFDALEGLLDDADIVLTALGSRRQVITSDMMLVAIHRRRKKPVYLVDTSLPGDIDPAINRIDETFLYDLGDLEGVVMAGRSTRESAAEGATKVVEEEVQAFLQGRSERAAVPALNDLRGHFEEVREQVLAEAGDDADKATRLLVNRLLHEPSESMRADAAESGGWAAVEGVIRRLFGLKGGDKNE
ncbi:MAG: glutamyl-tRNA reductase [Rhodospirillales bacterium]|nr:glutamyl-tRNA reductase [Rhodospirillales bacterium]